MQTIDVPIHSNHRVRPQVDRHWRKNHQFGTIEMENEEKKAGDRQFSQHAFFTVLHYIYLSSLSLFLVIIITVLGLCYVFSPFNFRDFCYCGIFTSSRWFVRFFLFFSRSLFILVVFTTKWTILLTAACTQWEMVRWSMHRKSNEIRSTKLIFFCLLVFFSVKTMCVCFFFDAHSFVKRISFRRYPWNGPFTFTTTGEYRDWEKKEEKKQMVSIFMEKMHNRPNKRQNKMKKKILENKYKDKQPTKTKQLTYKNVCELLVVDIVCYWSTKMQCGLKFHN